MKAAGSAYPDMKAKSEAMSAAKPVSAPKEDLPSGFRHRKRHTEPAPTAPSSNADTWTCPNCGKVMPKYISTCGCGTPQPFGFDDDNSSVSGSFGMPAVGKDSSADEDNRIMDDSEFTNAAPSLQSYSPQTDGIHSSNSSDEPASMPVFGFDDAPPPAPMRFDDAPPPAPMRFDDAPPPAPMRFDDAPPPAPMRFDDAPPPAPMRFSDAPPAAPVQKNDKKHLFGKKAKEAEVMRKAEAAAQNRPDVPGAGSTWTCPNCGKVMPKYVGTCGCGEPQPFEF